MPEKNAMIRWEPAIYEHKAALIKKSPGEVCRSADLLARALEAEFETYRADFMTVGIDVYNIEAESVGAEITDADAQSCPEIRTIPFALETFSPPSLPDATTARFPLLIEAAKLASKRIGKSTRLRIAASGPLTIASKLVGIEPLVMALAMEDEKAELLLEYCEALCNVWLKVIRGSGFEAIVFDSTAAPPVISPVMYTSIIAPYHGRIMSLLKNSGQDDRPLIIGGNTTPIACEIANTGANTVICDYAADAAEFVGALKSESYGSLTVRRNIDPALFIRSSVTLDTAAEIYRNDLYRFANPVAGTGILPYDADPDRYWSFRNLVAEGF